MDLKIPSMLMCQLWPLIPGEQKKRQFRSLWISKINAAARQNNMSYSQLINSLKKSNITLNRKMLADLAMNNAQNFTALIKSLTKEH